MKTGPATWDSGSAAPATGRPDSIVQLFFDMALPVGRRPRTAGRTDIGRYRRIWWGTVLLTFFVALTPLIGMVELNHFMYRRALTNEARASLARTISNAARSLRFALEERTAALDLLVRERQVEEFEDDVRLGRTLGHLQDASGGFVDLGLIRSDGRQVAYAGPYDLRGATYEDQAWFHEVAARGSAVSEVFLGHRELPHFVIAIRADRENFLVLRATLDMSLITDLVDASALGPSGDVFVVNREGIYQTPTRHHGNVLEPCGIPVPPRSSVTEVVEGVPGEDDFSMLGYRHIANSPFVLMGVRRGLTEDASWQWSRTEMWSILAVGTLLIGFVVLWVATLMVRRIRAADRAQAELLHRIEFTSKMATMGRLAASVAHEINNPLAIINEKAGLLRDLVERAEEHPFREKTLASIASIVRSVERCGKVTHRLLGFTRRLEPRPESIQLDGLLLEVLSFLGKEAETRNVAVETRFPPDVPAIRSDRGQLQQVFLNLLSNALAAVRDGGRIEIRLQASAEGLVSVAIEDDGVGIPADQLPRIFEPFFSMKGEFGTGLGLSITREIVQRLGGRIVVESQEGEGTTVTVTLPVEATPEGGPGE